MDLDKMKDNWEKLSNEIEKQKSITDKLVLDMTKEKYNKKMNGILIPELIGGIICFSVAAYGILNFDKLDTWYLQLCGVLFLVSLIIFPIIVLRSIFNLKKISSGNLTSRETLENFIEKKKNVIFVQKITAVSNAFLLFTTLPVCAKILNDKNIFLKPTKLLLFVGIMGVFLFFFTRFAINALKKKTKNMQELLESLEVS
ncbi:hypothetical protein [Aureivirga sp. CE67]|uniref:hypothetical protein n=1 Tax=Aureivirga sp. CE67 TaxID=1788983 RepID=UPI0018CA325F|nr:hypothetical protein [Aureivirga sp. CE67]